MAGPAVPCSEHLAAEEGLLAPEVESAASACSDGDGAAGPPSNLRRTALRAVGGVGLLVGLAFLATAAFSNQPSRSPSARASRAAVEEEAIGLSFFNEMTEVLGELKEGVKTMDEAITSTQESYENFTDMLDSIQDTAEELQNTSNEMYEAMNKPNKWKKAMRKKWMGMNTTQRAAFKKRLMRKLNITSWKQLRPSDNLTDGNICPDNEELHLGLCYTTCSDLTHGEYPYRTSAWSCSANAPPNVQKSVGEFAVCGGYATSHAADHCPHPAGACLKNEELFGGYCYKKCALITYGILMHRGAPSSCCNTRSRLAFLDATGCDTDTETYAVGGGKGYSPEEPREVHEPNPEFTEATA